MAADIILGDDAIELESSSVTISNDGAGPTSSSLNLRNSTGFWHLSGPRGYEPGNNFSIFWNDNSKWSGPMLAVHTNGFVGVGTGAPKSQLHVHGGEVYSSGNLAGYSFADRTKAGQRWVWYAEGGAARLYTDGKGDRITVNANGGIGCHELNASGSVACANAAAQQLVVGPPLAPSLDPNSAAKPVTNVVVSGGEIQIITYQYQPAGGGWAGPAFKPVPVKTVPLVALVVQLQQAVEQLQKELSALKAKLGQPA